MEKYFNVAGPCSPAKHYMQPALDRMPQIRRRVDQETYFVIHAPRQTGKTTAVQGLAEGWMPVFDDDAGKPWDERLFTRDATFDGKIIHVAGL